MPEFIVMTVVRSHRNKRRSGNSIVEFAFLAPWYIFLFLGAVDMGMYCYSLISIQSAARVASLYTSSSSTTAAYSTTACRYVLSQVRNLPNVPSTLTTCAASPVVVTAAAVTGPDGASASTVTVTYSLPVLAGIPGILPAQFSATRSVEMRLQN